MSRKSIDPARKAATADLRRRVSVLKRKGLVSKSVDVRKLKVVQDRSAARQVREAAARGDELHMETFRLGSRTLRKRLQETSDVTSPTVERVHGKPRVFKLTRKQVAAIRKDIERMDAEGIEGPRPRLVNGRLIVNRDQTVSKKGDVPKVQDRGFSRRRTITVVNKAGKEQPGWKDRLRAAFKEDQSLSVSLFDNGASMTRFFHDAETAIAFIEAQYMEEHGDGYEPLKITLWTMEERNALLARNQGNKAQNPRYVGRKQTKSKRKPMTDRQRENNRARQKRFRLRHKKG